MESARADEPLVEPSWLDELDLTPGPPVLHMGLRPLEAGTMLAVDDRRADELAMKARLFADRPSDVFAALDGSEEASEEALALVVDGLRSEHAIEPDLPATHLHPLARAALVTQEDLTVLAPGDGGYILTAGFVAFPSGWYLHQKLGRPLAAIHAPIPHYSEELSSKVDRIFDKVRPDRPLCRRNWFIYDNPDLFQPQEPANDVELVPSRLGRQLTIRSERQTIVRLPESGAVLFTIRTQQAPLEVLHHRPDIADDICRYIEHSPPASSANKGVAPYVDVLVRWLREI